MLDGGARGREDTATTQADNRHANIALRCQGSVDRMYLPRLMVCRRGFVRDLFRCVTGEKLYREVAIVVQMVHSPYIEVLAEM